MKAKTRKTLELAIRFHDGEVKYYQNARKHVRRRTLADECDICASLHYRFAAAIRAVLSGTGGK